MSYASNYLQCIYIIHCFELFLKDYLHSTNLGELNSELHNNDMDFTSENSAVCGAVLGCDCGSYTWSLQVNFNLVLYKVYSNLWKV